MNVGKIQMCRHLLTLCIRSFLSSVTLFDFSIKSIRDQ